ncbi:MAG: polymer-forming cytoskeletal protein [Rhodospirillaceae bacterium]|jgi:cytoskeletal protein CcmA (bactofilin family)|nr:polymer-forming cytoskeletal protein [Rhodospirillales bacterium]MBT3907378.1 polymer-forming cytoskeletal protein [Rhodospirillaceae bacterium]MBT4701683.1 polymer-forming cytoskeletal protein [Rhodospirillaceae bacterium]MBT5035046.1 polymer-forming cytoskeletal protein [Rhodospirillaceae bacterium]MBT6221823.1 polymer-forming cytoskeletal protein [Rhodospirillaceae bacterium]
MFSKTNNKSNSSSGTAAEAAVRSAPSILSSDMRITGNLNSDGEIQVDGTIEGDIRTKILLIGQGAEVKGEIVADSIHVHGTIHGQIKARSVVLAKTAHVVGDILHEDLSIEKGAFLEGHCKSISKSTIQKDSLNLVGNKATDAGVVPVNKDVKPAVAVSPTAQSAHQPPKKTIGA